MTLPRIPDSRPDVIIDPPVDREYNGYYPPPTADGSVKPLEQYILGDKDRYFAENYSEFPYRSVIRGDFESNHFGTVSIQAVDKFRAYLLESVLSYNGEKLPYKYWKLALKRYVKFRLLELQKEKRRWNDLTPTNEDFEYHVNRDFFAKSTGPRYCEKKKKFGDVEFIIDTFYSLNSVHTVEEAIVNGKTWRFLGDDVSVLTGTYKNYLPDRIETGEGGEVYSRLPTSCVIDTTFDITVTKAIIDRIVEFTFVGVPSDNDLTFITSDTSCVMGTRRATFEVKQVANDYTSVIVVDPGLGYHTGDVLAIAVPFDEPQYEITLFVDDVVDTGITKFHWVGTNYPTVYYLPALHAAEYIVNDPLGKGARFSVHKKAQYVVDLLAAGTGFSPGSFVIPGSQIGGADGATVDELNNMTINIYTVGSHGEILTFDWSGLPRGVDATFTVTKVGDINHLKYIVEMEETGKKYSVGDTFLLPGTSLGGTAVNDIIVTVTKVGPGKILTAFGGPDRALTWNRPYSVPFVGGSGLHAVIDFIIDKDGVYTLDTISAAGTGYTVGDTCTFPGSFMGGEDVTNDVVITVTTVDEYYTPDPPNPDLGPFTHGYITGVSLVGTGVKLLDITLGPFGSDPAARGGQGAVFSFPLDSQIVTVVDGGDGYFATDVVTSIKQAAGSYYTDKLGEAGEFNLYFPEYAGNNLDEDTKLPIFKLGDDPTALTTVYSGEYDFSGMVDDMIVHVTQLLDLKYDYSNLDDTLTKNWLFLKMSNKADATYIENIRSRVPNKGNSTSETYTNVVLSGGHGHGAAVTVYMTPAYTITLDSRGIGYSVNDVLYASGMDLTITVDGTSVTGQITGYGFTGTGTISGPMTQLDEQRSEWPYYNEVYTGHRLTDSYLLIVLDKNPPGYELDPDNMSNPDIVVRDKWKTRRFPDEYIFEDPEVADGAQPLIDNALFADSKAYGAGTKTRPFTWDYQFLIKQLIYRPTGTYRNKAHNNQDPKIVAGVEYKFLDRAGQPNYTYETQFKITPMRLMLQCDVPIRGHQTFLIDGTSYNHRCDIISDREKMMPIMMDRRMAVYDSTYRLSTSTNSMVISYNERVGI